MFHVQDLFFFCCHISELPRHLNYCYTDENKDFVLLKLKQTNEVAVVSLRRCHDNS